LVTEPDPQEQVLAHSATLDRSIVTPRGNLAVFDGFTEVGPAPQDAATVAADDQQANVLAYSATLDRHIVTPRGNLAVFDGFTEVGPVPADEWELRDLLAIRPVAEVSTDDTPVRVSPIAANAADQEGEG
jgi:hypothetical protein